MGSLTIYFILFTSFCFKDVWSKTHDHEVLKEVGVENRIRGGKKTTIEKHPYAAYLLIHYSLNNIDPGNGIIISPHTILTPARSIDKSIYTIIRVGSAHRREGGQLYNTTNYLIHPMWLVGDRNYDVGALIITEGIKLDGTTVKSINVVDLGDDPTIGGKITVMGWGYEGNGAYDHQSFILKEFELTVINREECEKGGEISGEQYFCTIDEKAKSAACYSDFGGPAVNENGLLAGMIFRHARCIPENPHPLLRFGEPLYRTFIQLVTV